MCNLISNLFTNLKLTDVETCYKVFRRDVIQDIAPHLRERGFERVFACGLAFDYCVRFSAEDAKTQGFEALVIEDACRAIDLDGSAGATRAAFGDAGIDLVAADAVDAV